MDDEADGAQIDALRAEAQRRRHHIIMAGLTMPKATVEHTTWMSPERQRR
jgi:hypothetical protein